MKKTTAIPDREAFPIEEGRQLLGGISRQSFYNLINSGRIGTVLIGKRRLVPATEIQRFLLENASAPPTSSAA